MPSRRRSKKSGGRDRAEEAAAATPPRRRIAVKRPAIKFRIATPHEERYDLRGRRHTENMDEIIVALSSWPLTWSRRGESSQGILGVPRSAELGAAEFKIGADMLMDPDREDLSPATWGRVLIRPALSEYLADCRQRKAALFKEERKLDEERRLAAKAGGEK